MRKLLLALAALAIAPAAHANSFANGSFESNAGSGQVTFNTSATGWTVAAGGYTFLYAPGVADTASAPVGQYGQNPLWGPGNGSANGLTAASPDGGYFIAQDGDFQVQPIQQIITGLTLGKTYTVGFDYAFAQQFGFNGDTVQHWDVSLSGNPVQSTADFNLPSHGFSGWLHQNFSFVADGATDTLTFLAVGNVPVPPFALLDGVTFTPDIAVPEPAVWTMMLAGFGGLGGLARRRRAAPAIAA